MRTEVQNVKQHITNDAKQCDANDIGRRGNDRSSGGGGVDAACAEANVEKDAKERAGKDNCEGNDGGGGGQII
jgi:hypothetical protein